MAGATIDPTKVQLLGDRILVRFDKPPVKRGEIYYPEGSFGDEGELYVWAKVVSMGPGKLARSGSYYLDRRVPMPDIHVGDEVLLVWFLSKVETNKGISAIIGDDYVIVKPEDLLAVRCSQD